MTAQQRHDLIKSIARDETLSDSEALRRIAEITPREFGPTRLKSRPTRSSADEKPKHEAQSGK